MVVVELVMMGAADGAGVFGRLGVAADTADEAVLGVAGGGC